MVSHRLRDTFAVDLLAKGVPLEHVSKLLGHKSVLTTERHYARWVKGRQDRLDNSQCHMGDKVRVVTDVDCFVIVTGRTAPRFFNFMSRGRAVWTKHRFIAKTFRTKEEAESQIQERKAASTGRPTETK
jgi:hypothetical protein